TRRSQPPVSLRVVEPSLAEEGLAPAGDRLGSDAAKLLERFTIRRQNVDRILQRDRSRLPKPVAHLGAQIRGLWRQGMDQDGERPSFRDAHPLASIAVAISR